MLRWRSAPIEISILMYPAVSTRPDIAFSVSYLSQFNDCFAKEHWLAAKRVLRYLRGSQDKGLVFKRNGSYLEGFADADWGSCPIDRRSYTGYVFRMNGAAVSWEARKQKTVALSSTEAEYMAMTETAKEAVCLRLFLRDIGFPVRRPIRIYGDNQGGY